MPTIAETKKGGYRIDISYSDHNPPHFHVMKGKRKLALVDIRNAVVIKGSLPNALLYRVLGWCVSHTKELMVDWELAKAGKPLNRIEWNID